MRPRLQVLDAPLVTSIVDEAKRLLDEVGMEIRGAEMRARLLDHGLPTTPDGRVRFPPDVVDRAIASAPGSFRLYDRDGVERADLGGRPRSFRARLERSARPRPSDGRGQAREHDRLRGVRPPGRRPRPPGLPRHRVLDERRHRGPGLRRLAPVPRPDELEATRRLRRVHRARRRADGRDDGAVPARPGGPHRPPDVDLHRHRDRQLPVQRGLVPEPASTASRRASRWRSCR